jgi:hypothetical protein
MSEAHDPPGIDDPPEAPDLPRQIHLYRAQYIGLPILFLLPVPAVLGVFGEARDDARMAFGGVELAVDYPSRLRSGQRSEITVRVRNSAADPPGPLFMVWDTAYLHGFAALERLPGRQGVSPHAVALAPGEEWTIRLELEGGALWQHRGSVAALVGGARQARLSRPQRDAQGTRFAGRCDRGDAEGRCRRHGPDQVGGAGDGRQNQLRTLGDREHAAPFGEATTGLMRG